MLAEYEDTITVECTCPVGTTYLGNEELVTDAATCDELVGGATSCAAQKTVDLVGDDFDTLMDFSDKLLIASKNRNVENNPGLDYQCITMLMD